MTIPTEPHIWDETRTDKDPAWPMPSKVRTLKYLGRAKLPGRARSVPVLRQFRPYLVTLVRP